MTNEERPRFVMALQALAAGFNREFTDALCESYWLALDDLPFAAVATAIKRAIRESKFMPSGRELRELAGAANPEMRALEAWVAVKRAIAAVGAYESVNFDDPAVNAAIRSLGGWRRLCSLDSEELDKWTRKEFEKAYTAYASAPSLHPDLTRHLPGIHESNNTHLGVEVKPRLLAVRPEAPKALPPRQEQRRLGAARG